MRGIGYDKDFAYYWDGKNVVVVKQWKPVLPIRTIEIKEDMK